jgi:hypothetical protein
MYKKKNKFKEMREDIYKKTNEFKENTNKWLNLKKKNSIGYERGNQK